MSDAPSSSELPLIATLSPLPDSSPLRPTHVGSGGWDEESDVESELDELDSSPPGPAQRAASPGTRKRSLSPSASVSGRQKRPCLCTKDASSEFSPQSQQLPSRPSSHLPPKVDSSSSVRSSSPVFHFSSIAGSESEDTSPGDAGSASEDDEDLVVDALSRSDEPEPHKLAFHYPLQSALSTNPWLVVLASAIIESIQGASAVSVYSEIASQWHTPSDLLSKDFCSGDLLDILSRHVPALPIKHLVHIRKLAQDYNNQPPDMARLSEFANAPSWLTPYIRDALRIFCVPDEWRNVQPKDPHFIEYLKARWASDGKIWDPEQGVLGARHAVIPIAALPSGSRNSAYITLSV